MKYSETNKIVHAIRVYFSRLSVHEEFDGVKLVEFVRAQIDRPNIYADTVMRYAREMKQNKEINFRCLNPSVARYKKMHISEGVQLGLEL